MRADFCQSASEPVQTHVDVDAVKQWQTQQDKREYSERSRRAAKGQSEVKAQIAVRAQSAATA
eukprot:9057445-Lingulodinium_polyedra.AAC.1